MKIFILFFLISSKIFAADLSAETVKNIKCYFYDDPNENPIMMLYFTGDNNKLELIVDQAENSSDEALVNTIFQNEVKVEEVNGKIVVTAEGLLLEMKTPIAYWSHGESRDSMLTLKSFDLATHLVCEQQ